MAKTMKFNSVKSTLWGVFAGGTKYGAFRSLEAAFTQRIDAVEWARQFKKDHGSEMQIEEIKIVIPAWDGKFPDQNEFVTKIKQF